MKITPHGDIAILEFNGSNAGTEAFPLLYGETLLQERRTLLEETRKRYRAEMQCMFLGEHPAYKYQRTTSTTPLGDPSNIWNPLGLSIFCKDKGGQKWTLPAEHTSPGIVCRGKDEARVQTFLTSLRRGQPAMENGTTALIDLESAPYVVVKKAFASVAGEGVWILPMEDETSVAACAANADWDIVEHDGCLL